MPAITPIFATNFVADSGDETVFTSTGCQTAALSSGIDYLVFYGAMARNTSDVDYTAEVHIVHGALEVGMVEANESFVGGPAGAYGGYPLAGVAVVTGNGVDALSIERRRVGGSALDQVEVNGQYIYAIPLDGFVPNIHYFYGQNSLPLLTSAAIGWEPLESLTFTAEFSGVHSFISSYEYETSVVDEANIRISVIEDPGGAAITTIIRDGQLVKRDTTGIDSICGRHVFQFNLVSGTVYQVNIEADADVDGSRLGRCRTFVFSPMSLGDGSDPGQIYNDSSVGFVVTGTGDEFGNAPIIATAPAVSEPDRLWIILGDLTKKVTFWSQERIVEDPSGAQVPLNPITGFGANDIGIAAANDLLHTALFAASTLTDADSDTEYVANSEGLGVAANNIYGYDEASGTGTVEGEALLALWMYSPDPIDVSVSSVGASVLTSTTTAVSLLYGQAIGASQMNADIISAIIVPTDGTAIGSSQISGSTVATYDVSATAVGVGIASGFLTVTDMALRGATTIRLRDLGDSII